PPECQGDRCRQRTGPRILRLCGCVLGRPRRVTGGIRCPSTSEGMVAETGVSSADRAVSVPDTAVRIGSLPSSRVRSRTTEAPGNHFSVHHVYYISSFREEFGDEIRFPVLPYGLCGSLSACCRPGSAAFHL